MDVWCVDDLDELGVAAGDDAAGGRVGVRLCGLDDVRPEQALDRVHLLLGEQRVDGLQEVDDRQPSGLVAKHPAIKHL